VTGVAEATSLERRDSRDKVFALMRVICPRNVSAKGTYGQERVPNLRIMRSSK